MTMSGRSPSYYRFLAVAVFALTLLAVLLPGSVVDAGSAWLKQWLPAGGDYGGAAGYTDKLVHAGLFALCGLLLALGWLDEVRHWGVVITSTGAVGAKLMALLWACIWCIILQYTVLRKISMNAENLEALKSAVLALPESER